MSTNKKTQDVAILGMFSAITIVLQLISYMVKIGTFSLSLVLIPIVLVAVMYGPKYGAIIGAVFGAITAIGTTTQALDPGGSMLFQASPALTVLVCFVKGVLTGFVAGLVAKPLKSKNIYLAVILAAVIAPIVNTGVFVLCMFAFFYDILTVWATDWFLKNGIESANLIYYTILGLTGINFIIEFTINLVFSPAILRVTKAFSKNKV